MDTNMTVNMINKEERELEETEQQDVDMDSLSNNNEDTIDTTTLSNNDSHNEQHEDTHMTDHEEVKKEKKEAILSEPASWQIPVGALQARVDPPVNKATLRKERLESRIKDNKYDIEAWSSLINDAQQTGDLDVIRDVYERFLKVFPTSPKHWLSYLELELKYSNFNEVEALFTRCLKTVLSVDLWKFYLGYIRRINLGESGSSVTPEARVIIEKAYEYVLNNVGMDKDAGPIWADYIFFLKSAETSNTWEEQRKMDSMRRAYQKAVTIPLNNVEHLWKEYDQWENNLNRLTAKKFLGEKSSAYMTARTALREMRLFTDNIHNSGVSLPPHWTPTELAQLELWKKYIEWEKSDPLKLEDEAAVMERVSYTYQQAFLVLRLYPELWYSYASYYREHNKPEKALSILKQGIEILPTSLLLNFCYAELCESRKQLDDAKQAFDTLIENIDKDIEDIKQVADKEMNKLSHEVEEEKASLKLAEDVDGELREQLRIKEKHIKKEQNAIQQKMNEQIEVLARASSLVWICYMRFARRTEGIRSARSLFSKARKAPNCTYHVFVSSALMEYHNSKDASIAGKVFTLGHKLFADNPDFVCQYLDFLIQMNDDNNTRALFERTLATMPAEKATPIWLKFLDYENKYGDLASVQSVEERRMAAVPSASPLESFLLKHSYLDINNISEHELGTVAREQHVAEVNTVIPPEIIQQTNAMSNERPQTKEHVKRPLLEPVHPERYSRPDFNQWQAYKPSADTNRRPVANTLNSPVPAVAAPDVPVVDTNTNNANIPIASTPMWNNSLSQQPLPDAVAYFVSNLPPAQSFNGPLIQPGELVDLLRNIIIPLPPQGGSLPSQPIQPSMRAISQQQQQSKIPMHSSRDMSPMRNNYSSRGRGGFKARGGNNNNIMRGGNKQNVKRRMRDDYDDDHQSHKGIGPNRPPDYDLFRQRHAKRHRDDPPY